MGYATVQAGFSSFGLSSELLLTQTYVQGWWALTGYNDYRKDRPRNHVFSMRRLWWLAAGLLVSDDPQIQKWMKPTVLFLNG